MSCVSRLEARFKVPANVKREAELGLLLKKNGFAGGTSTGWSRARQLKDCDYIDRQTVITMRAWFARHGPRAKNGGTSHPGYLRWVADGKPKLATQKNKNKYRGAVAWLIWGGDPAFKWIDSISSKV